MHFHQWNSNITFDRRCETFPRQLYQSILVDKMFLHHNSVLWRYQAGIDNTNITLDIHLN